ncbi:MAG: hypothetical protein J2P46_07120 [Zavarzinella sp.]|nr:hypothetical protein [Zavarzinella sp.]
MTKSRSRDLYGSLYLFFARGLGGVESSTIEFGRRHPEGVWVTRVETGCGMCLHRPPLGPEAVYTKHPANAVEFAQTGGDGVFYSFLEADGTWGDDSPVVVTFPAGFAAEPSWIAGSCLRDFLRLGRWVGFFSLGGLVVAAAAGDRDAIRALSAREHPEWVEAEQAQRLDRMAAEFKLEPLTNVAKRVVEWQERYRPLVRHPAGPVRVSRRSRDR